MHLVFLNNKGGVGKTTTSVLLAQAYADIGRRVRLVDLDPQRTATQFAAKFPALHPASGGVDAPEITVTDCPPRLDAPGLKAAYAQATLLVLVTMPSPLDLWTAAKATREIAEAYPDTPRRLLFNGVERGTALATMLDEMATQVGAPRLTNVLHKRAAYRMAALTGAAALTPAAKTEVFRLATEVASLKHAYK